MEQRYYDDYELVIRLSKRLERLLEEKYGAQGKGLHEKTMSVAGRVDPLTVRKLHYIAAIRNKLVHDDSYERLDDRQSFINACHQAEAALTYSGAPRLVQRSAGTQLTGCQRLLRMIGSAAGVLLFIKIAESLERQKREYYSSASRPTRRK